MPVAGGKSYKSAAPKGYGKKKKAAKKPMKKMTDKKKSMSKKKRKGLIRNKLEKERMLWLRKSDPKKGTGKKPKNSGRRLYTDENPKDTVR